MNSSKLEQETKLRARIAASPNDPDEYLALTRLLLSTGRGEEAISVCRNTLALPLTKFQKAKVSSELGWVFYGMARHAEAIQSAESALSLLPEGEAAPEILLCQGRSYSVIALCQWANKEADIKSKEAARLALQCYERLMQEAPDLEAISTVYYDASQLESLLGNNKLGIDFCKTYLKFELEDGEQAEGLNHLATLLRCENRIPEAEAALEQAFLLAMDDNILLSALYFSQGLLKRSINSPEEARQSFQKALELRQDHTSFQDDPNFCGDAYWNLGELNYQQQDYVGALEAFKKILLYHPEADLDHRNALLWMGCCYDLLGDSRHAVECFEKLLTVSTASESERREAEKGIAWAIGKTLYGQKEYAGATARFEEVVAYQANDDPEWYRTLLWLGHSYLGVKDYQRAQSCYRQIVDSLYATDFDKEAATKALVEIPHSPHETIH